MSRTWRWVFITVFVVMAGLTAIADLWPSALVWSLFAIGQMIEGAVDRLRGGS